MKLMLLMLLGCIEGNVLEMGGRQGESHELVLGMRVMDGNTSKMVRASYWEEAEFHRKRRERETSLNFGF